MRGLCSAMGMLLGQLYPIHMTTLNERTGNIDIQKNSKLPFHFRSRYSKEKTFIYTFFGSPKFNAADNSGFYEELKTFLNFFECNLINVLWTYLYRSFPFSLSLLSFPEWK